MSTQAYDIVAVGTGFATTFFLHRLLSGTRKPLRILVLEGGQKKTHAELLALRGSDDRPNSPRHQAAQFENLTPEKAWFFTSAFGGSSNCWYACTPRLMPEDFELKSRYGIGADWPLSYDDLEAYYCEAEELMNVAGDSADSPYPRSRPYPQRPHRFTDPDRALKKAFPAHIFAHPAARSPDAVPGQRAGCCNNGVCGTCPIDAKFSILNGMTPVYSDPRVELRTQSRVQSLDHSGGRITGVTYRQDGRDQTVACGLAVLGANALFNPHLLLRSGLDGPEVGRGLCEQVSVSVSVDLDGMNNFQGSTVSTALGYMFYAGAHRRERAAAMLQTINLPRLRNQRGKWLQTLDMNFVFEEFRLPENTVGVSPRNPELATTRFVRKSELTERGIAALKHDVSKVLAALPASSHRIGEPWKTDSHIMGTTVMGSDPATSVVDADSLHHRLRNLVVLGSGTFPTAAPANPTLTLCALALRSGHRISTWL